MQTKYYESSQVLEVIDIPLRRLVHFAERSAITPYKDTLGAGRKREYDYNNLIEIKICNELYEAGLQIGTIKKVLDGCRANGRKYEGLLPISFNKYLQIIINLDEIKQSIKI